MASASKKIGKASAKGRLDHGPPIAVIDIGSNSVRLVVYEGLTRSPTPVFNEKVLCGLGREVASRGKLAESAVEEALRALRRFRLLCDQMDVQQCHVLATAAVREAENGPEFAAAAEEAVGREIEILSGSREAELSALGIVAGIEDPDGICGDLGGGSLELVDIAHGVIGDGVTLPLGGLRLRDLAGSSMKNAAAIVDSAFAGSGVLKSGKGRAFYAVGGTFRALARLHMAQCNYPLHVIHQYAMTPEEALDFAKVARTVDVSTLDSIEQVSSARRDLLPLGALVLEKLIEVQQPSCVCMSSLGVREGYLYGQLSGEQRAQDPLILSASEMAQLRSRSPRHAVELCEWTDAFLASSKIDETPAERRLRHTACLLADIGWRAHPDYRGVQSLNIILHANFTSVDHPGRAYVGMAVYLRHTGLNGAHPPGIRELISARMLDRARILGGAMRVAYMITASMPGVLPRAPMMVEGDKLVLTLPSDLGGLAGARTEKRLRQLAKLIGREPETRIV